MLASKFSDSFRRLSLSWPQNLTKKTVAVRMNKTTKESPVSRFNQTSCLLPAPRLHPQKNPVEVTTSGPLACMKKISHQNDPNLPKTPSKRTKKKKTNLTAMKRKKRLITSTNLRDRQCQK